MNVEHAAIMLSAAVEEYGDIPVLVQTDPDGSVDGQPTYSDEIEMTIVAAVEVGDHKYIRVDSTYSRLPGLPDPVRVLVIWERKA